MAYLRRLWLEDFRNYRTLELALGPGTTVVVGGNGQGKSNLVEAIGWLGTLSSFRGVTNEVLIRAGAPKAVIRADAVRNDRELLVEAELAVGKAARVQVNRQRIGRAKDLVGLVPATVFAPDDLDLVKGGPAGRRGYLDDLLVQVHPGHGRVHAELERVLKQRNAVLRQSHGRMSAEIEATLAVWDHKLVETGEAWGARRHELVERLSPQLSTAYRRLAGSGELSVRYDAPWRAEGLAAAIAEARGDELRRGVSLVGPHRDELAVVLDGLAVRTHASQGEQRTAALALRMAGHTLTTDAHDTSPILVLDDVFSELDSSRATALLAHLEAEQTFITSADRRPESSGAVRLLEIADGEVQDPAFVIGTADPPPTLGVVAWKPLPGTRSDPQPLGSALDRVLHGLGAGSARTVQSVIGDWDTIAGADLATWCSAIAVRGDTVVVAVSDPLLRVELGWHAEALLSRLADHVGTKEIRRIDIVVRQP